MLRFEAFSTMPRCVFVISLAECSMVGSELQFFKALSIAGFCHGGLARMTSEHYLALTGCKGGGLTSCPWSPESGSGSEDSAAAAALRRFSSSDSAVFCRSMVGFTPTSSGGIGDPTVPQPVNNSTITLAAMNVALVLHVFTR